MLRANRRALRNAGIYALIGFGWILFSDKLVLAFAPDIRLLYLVGIWKGLAFVLATAMVLYLVAAGESRSHANADAEPISEATRASEARYRSLFDNMLEGLAYCRLLYESGQAQDFVYLDVNPAFERLTGLCDVVGKKVSDVIPGIRESSPVLFETYGRVAASGKPERFETYVDALGIWFSISVYCPEPEYFIAVFDNITERKQAQEALARESCRNQAFLHHASDGIHILDEEGYVIEVSDSFCSMLGFSREDLIGAHASLWDAQWSPHQLKNIIGERLAGENRTVLETTHRRKDGSLIDVELMGQAPELDGRLVLFYSSRDITARKRAEASLRMLSAAVEQSPVSIVMTDTAGDIEYVNHKFTQLTGYSLQELQGRNLRILKSGETPAEEYKRLWETITAGGEWAGELQNRKKDGELFWEFARILPICDAQGCPISFLAVKEDITERKRADAAILELNVSLERRVAARTEELERTNRELDAFSYSVSHDLRVPVRTVMGYCRMLEEEEVARLSPDGRMWLGHIVRNTQRMGEMIEDLLRLSRVERGSLKLQQVDLDVVVSNVIVRLAGDYPKAEISAARMPEVLCDHSLVRQVFENLVSNALKYSAKKAAPKIEIGVESRDGEAAYFVRDNGAGFDMRHADKLFGVFQRLHGASEFPGTGVGLVIVKRIIERHGGRIWAEGEPDNGATFRFTLGQG